MKKDPLSPSQETNKISPARPQSNPMMLNWLNKANAKKQSESENKNKSTADKNETKTTSVVKSPIKKEETTSKKEATKSATAAAKTSPKTKKTSPKKESETSTKKTSSTATKTKSTKHSIKDDDDEDDFEIVSEKKSKTTSSSKSSKEKASAASEKDETTKTTPGKKGGSKFYAAYMRREGPKNPGSKRIPIGKKDCFAGLKFLVTGVMDSLDRQECQRIVEKYGGSCISGVTKKLDYLIVGQDAGQSKLNKADELNIKQISEDQFLELICKKSGITNPKYEDEGDDQMQMDVDEDIKKEPEEDEEVVVQKSSSKSGKRPNLKLLDESDEDEKPPSKKTTPKKLNETNVKKEPENIKKEMKSPIKLITKVEPKLEPKIETKPIKKENENECETKLWVEKHKPTHMSKIIGQSQDKSNAKKLLNWLNNWQKYNGPNSKSIKKTWNDQDAGTCYKAALLSGPPGIGKTTTATLVCKEAGFTFIELNASDSRSKKLLDKVLGESSESCSMDSYLKGKHSPTNANSDKHCIIMDEVDGMAGTEDRGGISELINTIKSSKIPIICICNDRQHIKIRSLANHCFDLRFFKPRLEQVRAALMSICFKEKIQADNAVLDQIITGCNYDIRQCLNNLSMWSSNNKTFRVDNTKNDIQKAMKDIRMNPFEACKQVFQCDPNGANKKTMIEKLDLFFADYGLMPLLVHENYLNVKPFELKGNSKKQKDLDHLNRIYESIESMCHSDRIGRMVRTNNNWSLLPVQAIFTTVVPGDKLSGNIGLPAFPGWFGKNSKIGRVDRILQELQKHMRMKISANKLGVGMDYLSVLKLMLSKPLIKRGSDGIDDVLTIMNEYNLTRDDFDTILELSTWPGDKDPMSLIESKVKAAFTRAYNKESHKNPFTIVNIKKLKASKINDDVEGEEIEEESEDEKDDDITADAMIKVNTKKKTTAVKSAAKSSGPVKRNSDNSDTVTSKPASKKKKT